VKRNSYRKVGKTPLTEISAVGEGRTLEDNIKMDIREVRYEDGRWMRLHNNM
jgi:hypothetical protein